MRNPSVAHWQRELQTGICRLVALDELLQEPGQLAHLIRAALAQLAGDVFRNVPWPAPRSIKTNDADGIAELTFQQIAHDGFEIGLIDIGLTPGRPDPAEVVEHKIDVAVLAWND